MIVAQGGAGFGLRRGRPDSGSTMNTDKIRGDSLAITRLATACAFLVFDVFELQMLNIQEL